MADQDKLRLADSEELEQSLAFALMLSGRKRFHDGDRPMARIAAQFLVRYLESAESVVMQKPPTSDALLLAQNASVAALA
jgi:hypothetical protein